ncbi:MAG: aminopeptidase [Planctomycetes bacterium HGW-Planctomycetes-1]|nr:MAG: aminopeptidase [Planctomycetes bacterium HGW-Planctomycetes-1]
MIRMPGKSYSGPLPALTNEQILIRDGLVRDVNKLAGEIGERNIWNYKRYLAAADFIEDCLVRAGYKVRRQEYEVEKKTCYNIEAERLGTKYPEQIIVIGAHYDSVYGTVGANDNASGAAAVLALARYFAGVENVRTLRFVLFVNEEPPFYHTDKMGSMVYAKRCRTNGDNIIAMLSLETIGYYSDEPGSQKYPFPFNLAYPSTGNFIGFVSNLGDSRKLLHTVIGSFRKNCQFPSEGGAIPEIVAGINWSDHWSFWQYDYPAIMVTDTAPFRYKYYHSPYDTPDKIDYDRTARAVSGLQSVIAELDSRGDVVYFR